MNKEYEVTMWVESDGEPEDDPCLTKIVVAQNKHTALAAARLLVRDENPEVNYVRIGRGRFTVFPSETQEA